MSEREPVFVPPTESKWRFWRSYKFQKFLYYVDLPRGRLVTFIVGGSLFYCMAFNLTVYLIKGPGHPLNNYRWTKMKEKGLLTPEMLEKERLLLKYDEDKLKENMRSVIPKPVETSKVSSSRLF